LSIDLTTQQYSLHPTVSNFLFCSVHALREIEDMRKDGNDIRAAVASKTDEPRWAKICMQHMVIDKPGEDAEGGNQCSSGRLTTLQDCFTDLVEISYGSKVNHIQRLHKKTGIDYADMCFFDNEHWNIQDASRGLPDVKSYYTPNGMTQEAWEQAKRDFGMV
jgi:Acid Phosphatase